MFPGWSARDNYGYGTKKKKRKKEKTSDGGIVHMNLKAEGKFFSKILRDIVVSINICFHTHTHRHTDIVSQSVNS